MPVDGSENRLILKKADIVCTTEILIKPYLSNMKHECRENQSKTRKANPYYLGDRIQIKVRESKESPVEVIAFAGIAKPNRFFEMLKEMGYINLDTHPFSDHHNYTESDVKLLIEKCRKQKCNHIATTEKDAAKIIELMIF